MRVLRDAEYVHYREEQKSKSRVYVHCPSTGASGMICERVERGRLMSRVKCIVSESGDRQRGLTA